MMFAKYIKLRTKGCMVVLVVVVSLVIFAISVIQASWANLADDSNFDRFRINPIEFEIEREGQPAKEVKYYLPQVNQLPGQILYPIKRLRDNLWLKMCREKETETKLYLLLADKKIAELLILSQKKKISERTMLNCAGLAIDYLEKANNLSQTMDNVIEARKVKSKVDVARYFYSQILESVGAVSGRTDDYKSLSEKVLSIEVNYD